MRRRTTPNRNGFFPFRSGGVGFTLIPCFVRSCEESRQRRQHALVSFAQKCGQNVLADPLPPEVIAAVAARVRGGVQVDPMVLRPASDAIAAVADALTVEPEAPLQPIEVDATSGVEVDHDFSVHT